MSCPIEIERRVLCTAENAAMASRSEEGLSGDKEHENALSHQRAVFHFDGADYMHFFHNFIFSACFWVLVCNGLLLLPAEREGRQFSHLRCIFTFINNGSILSRHPKMLHYGSIIHSLQVHTLVVVNYICSRRWQKHSCLWQGCVGQVSCPSTQLRWRRIQTANSLVSGQATQPPELMLPRSVFSPLFPTTQLVLAVCLDARSWMTTK